MSQMIVFLLEEDEQRSTHIYIPSEDCSRALDETGRERRRIGVEAALRQCILGAASYLSVTFSALTPSLGITEHVRIDEYSRQFESFRALHLPWRKYALLSTN